LPTYLIEELRNDSELEEVSLNSFVTRIFSNHIQWERYERKVGLLPMTKPFLKEVLNQMTEEQVIGLAHKIEKDSFKSILRFMNENIELEDFLRFLRTWLTASWMQHNIEIIHLSICNEKLMAYTNRIQNLKQHLKDCQISKEFEQLKLSKTQYQKPLIRHPLPI
jgi:hypothetical protein